MITNEDGSVTISMEDYKYYKKRDAQLEHALDMIPNLDDVIEGIEE